MRRMLVTTIVAATAGLTVPSAVEGQTVSLEIRGGLNRPVSEFRDPGGMEARGDAGFGGDVMFNVSPAVSLYGGYGWDRFGCVGCGDGDWITSRGFEAGAKFILPSESPNAILPWVRGGIVANKAKVDIGGFETTSDSGLGLQLSVGADLPLGEVLSFSPALRYQRFSADFPTVGDFLTASETVSYLSLDLGLHVHPHLARR